MSTDPQDGTPEPVTTQPQGRYSHKSPGRVAFMKKLNQEGRTGMGGRKVTHGVRALVERLKRGLDEETPLAVLHAEYRGRYVADLGGEDNCSAMELGVADRLADLDLIRGLLNCQRDASKRMSLAQLETFAGTVSKNCAAYLQGVKTIGPGRRQKDADKQFIVRRPYGEAQPSNGTEQEHPS
jgi:hypothetical protein